MRLLMPDRLIPASLDVEGIEGLRSRLDAGANVVTSLVPPRSGLCGVAHAEYEVDDGLRTVAEVRPRLAELGLRQGTPDGVRGVAGRSHTRQREDHDGAPVRLVVVGGKLQGTEAAYLGLKAGYHVVLVDRRPGVPASGLAAETHVFDVCEDEARTRQLFMGCDAVLPACEDDDTLVWLAGHAAAWGVPLLFDLPAFSVSSSKLRSNRLFDHLGVARPAPWPSCGFPIIVKPSGSSGSDGSAASCTDEDELAAARAELEARGHEAVVEEFVPGPSLSLEVIAWDGMRAAPSRHRARVRPLLRLQARARPCRRAECRRAGCWPASMRSARQLALGLGLDGVMDVEVIVHAGAAEGP